MNVPLIQVTRPPATAVTDYCCCLLATQFSIDWRLKRDHRRREELVALGMDPLQCGNRASIRIDGRYYCRRHAQEFALKFLMEHQ